MIYVILSIERCKEGKIIQHHKMNKEEFKELKNGSEL